MTYTPPATQQELDRIIEDRLARVRAKYPDYDEVQAKAALADGLQTRITELETTNGELTSRLEPLPGSTREEPAEAPPAISGPVIPGQDKMPPPARRSHTSEFLEELFDN